MLESFYATVAQASFTLLALWWVLLQIRYGQWMSDARLRLRVYDVSLYFLLPGMMSLGSLLAVGTPTVWRVSFAAAGVVGALESLLPIRSPRGPGGSELLMRAADWLSFAVYLAIAAVAIWRSIPDTVGIELSPIEVEGILVAALLGLGIVLAAALFVRDAALEER